jgi:TonB family protein
MGGFDVAHAGMRTHLYTFLLVPVVALFSVAAIVAVRFLRRGAARFWIGPAVVALALLPGVVSVVLSALLFRDVLGGIAIVGSGAAALAAGSVESLLPVWAGFACVALLSALGLLLVAAGSARGDDQPASGGGIVGLLAAPIGVLAAFAPLAALCVLVARVNGGGLEPAAILLWWRLAVFGAAVVAVGLLASAVASALAAPRGRAPLLAKAVPVLSLLLAGLGTIVTAAVLSAGVGRLSERAWNGAPREPGDGAPLAEQEREPEGSVAPEPSDVEPGSEPEAPSAAMPPAAERSRPRPAATRAEPLRRGAVRVGGTIKEPRKLKNVNPSYPEIAKQARVQGVVILECTIGSDGRVQEVKVLRGIPLLDDAAVDAVRQWVYTPTLLNGVPVPVIMTVTVHFKLS